MIIVFLLIAWLWAGAFVIQKFETEMKKKKKEKVHLYNVNFPGLF